MSSETAANTAGVSSSSDTSANSPQAAHTAVSAKVVPLAEGFLASGSIVLSRTLPTSAEIPVKTSLQEFGSEEFAPLLGYLPPTDGLLPAENETWMQIDRAKSELSIFKGQELVKTISVQGAVTLAPGTYPLQHKQRRPLWYANDEYFAKRQLPIPPQGDRQRYRRGALGQFVLYPTVNFPIHSAPVWSEDVGGLRVSRSDLSSIYYLLPLGTSVVVR